MEKQIWYEQEISWKRKEFEKRKKFHENARNLVITQEILAQRREFNACIIFSITQEICRKRKSQESKKSAGYILYVYAVSTRDFKL